MNALSEITQVLDTYKGRDKFLRTLCYTAKLIGGLSKDETVAKKFFIFSSRMSGARAVMRLLDDIPMLQYTLEYGLGKSEPNRFMAVIGVVTNFIDQMYYPIEKMAWFAENGLISDKNLEKWDFASSVCWVLSIYLTLLKSLHTLVSSQKHKQHIAKDAKALSDFLKNEKNEILTCMRLSLDLIHAVNTLPSGFLWSSKLETWHVGFIATVSSFLGLYQLFAKRRS